LRRSSGRSLHRLVVGCPHGIAKGGRPDGLGAIDDDRVTALADTVARIQAKRAGCPDKPWEIVMPTVKKAAPAAKKAAATAKTAPAKAAAQATVTLKHLAAALADSHDLAKKQAEAVLGDLVTLATKHLKRGDKIRLTGLGILQVRKRAARMGRNPATGETIKIKASKKVAFRPAKELKEAV
jgi:DNA-binding protein HU-beta